MDDAHDARAADPEARTGDGDESPAAEPDGEPEREPPPPIESRFLYVDVAAQRAKQLRRGALPRLEDAAADPDPDAPAAPQPRLERIAMREVDSGKIHYEVPAPPPAPEDDGGA